LKTDGISGLFAGYFATLVRDIPYTMLELGLYENIKTVFRKMRNSADLSASDELIAAAITGGVTSFVSTPLDVIKTKLMMQVIKQYYSSVLYGMNSYCICLENFYLYI
jgi:solute carrier family 25 S-adenosylmethionine transporter 26